MNLMSETETTLVPLLLKGSIAVQYIRCSKPGCRCLAGEKHGPYYYRIWREGVHIRKEYIKGDDLAAVQAACDAHVKMQERVRRYQQQTHRLTQNIKRECRRTSRLLRP